MQGNQNSTFETRILLATLLAGLLLVAPCKVRNTIETSLGMTTSKVSNKIKSTVAKTSCASYDANLAAKTEMGSSQDLGLSLAPAILSVALLFPIRNSENNVLSTRFKKSSLIVPLYILYLHFKVYL